MNIINQVHLEANDPEEVMGNLVTCKHNFKNITIEGTNPYHL